MEKILNSVKKRDGRIVSYDKQKIAGAIFKAAQSVGGQDKYLAEDLAEVVSMYLVKVYKKDIPSVEDIQDIVERVLIKTGHAKTAKAYILYRQKRARIRRIKEGLHPEDAAFLSENDRKNLIRNINLTVRESGDNISFWDKNRIKDALVRETGISGNIAELIVGEVEEEVISSKVKNLSSSVVRELVNSKLITYGLEEERSRHARLGVPIYDVKNLLREADYTPDMLSIKLGRHIKKEYALLDVVPERVADSHLQGLLHIHNLESIDKFFSVFLGDAISETGFSVEEIAPFVEDNFILRVPPWPDSSLGNSSEHKPSIIRETLFSVSEAERKGAFEALLLNKLPEGVFPPVIDERTCAVEIENPFEKGRVYLNRVSANPYYENVEGVSAADGERMEQLFELCRELKSGQQSFMEQAYSKKRLPDILMSSEYSIQIQIEGFFSAGCLNRRMVVLNKLLSPKDSFSARIDIRHDVRTKREDIVALVKSCIEAGFQVRVLYV